MKILLMAVVLGAQAATALAGADAFEQGLQDAARTASQGIIRAKAMPAAPVVLAPLKPTIYLLGGEGPVETYWTDFVPQADGSLAYEVMFRQRAGRFTYARDTAYFVPAQGRFSAEGSDLFLVNGPSKTLVASKSAGLPGPKWTLRRGNWVDARAVYVPRSDWNFRVSAVMSLK